MGDTLRAGGEACLDRALAEGQSKLAAHFSMLAAAINVARLGRVKLTSTQSGHGAVATA